MFGTLRLGSRKDSPEFIEHVNGEEAARLGGSIFSHSACDNCRHTKLRCNGHKPSCDRCQSKSLDCTYQIYAEGRRSRHKQKTQAKTPREKDASGSKNSRTTNDLPASFGQGSWSLDGASQSGDNMNAVPDLAVCMDSDSLASPADTFDDPFSFIPDHSDDAQMHDFISGRSQGLLDAEGFNAWSTPTEMLDTLGVEDGMLSAFKNPEGSPFESDLNPYLIHHTPCASTSSSASCVLTGNTSPSLGSRPGSAPIRSLTDPSSCRCLKSLLGVLDKIDAKLLATAPTNMYDSLAAQRHAVGTSNSVLGCRICNGRIEYITLLRIISKQITNLLDAVVTAFATRGGGLSIEAEANANSISNASSNGVMRLGQFEIETQKEARVLAAAMIKLQLRKSFSFVTRTRKTAALMDRVIQVQELKKLEQKLGDLSVKMRRVTVDIELDDE